jgi:hypothetical protein
MSARVRGTPNPTSVRFRIRTIDRLQAGLQRSGTGRLQMGLVLLGTGAAGFLCSYAMLHLGVTRMGLRYLLAVACAYGVFLLLLWVWLIYHRRATTSADGSFEWPGISVRGRGGGGTSGEPPVSFGGGQTGGGGAGGSFETPQAGLVAPIAPLDGSSVGAHLGSESGGAGGSHSGSGEGSGSGAISRDLDLGDAKPEGIAVLVIVLAIVAAVLASVCASVYVVYIAPHMMAEILFDGGLMAGLYARMKSAPQRSWVTDAIGHTWFPALVTGLGFLLAGAVIQEVLPNARSIGDVARVLASP